MPAQPRAILTLSLVAIASGVFGYTWWRSQPQPIPTPSARISVPPPPPVAVAPPRPDVDLIFRDEVKPILARFEERNRLAADAAVADVRERLNGRRWGITPFVKDVNRWGTRFGVMRKSAGDFWDKHWHGRYDPAAVKLFVDEKFRHHVMSERALEGDLGAALATFHEAIEASRNRLYVDLRLPLEKIRTHDGATTAPADVDAFRRQVEEQAKAQSERMGEALAGDSVAQGLNTILVSTVAAEVSQRIVAGVVTNVLARVGTQLAGRTVAVGGATAAGAATGGGGGSLAGPAGTVVGVAVGLTVGIVVDMWMSKKFEAKMTAELNGYFDTVSTHLIDGGDRGNGGGLKASLGKSVDHLNAVQRQAVYNAMKEMAR